MGKLLNKFQSIP